MESTVEENSPVFKTCGIEITFEGVEMPENIAVSHSVPENISDFASKCKYGSAGDVVINIGGKLVLANREILSSRIPYFKSLFHSEMIESDGKINLSNEFCEFGLTTINILLEYAYTGQLTISTTNVQDLILGAQFLGMEAVVNECAEFMRRRLSIDNILSIISLCKTVGCREIDFHLLNFFDTNFVPLSLTAQFLELSFQDLEVFVQRDSLHVDEEEQVFEAIKRWIENEPERKKYAERLLKCVRCTLISISYITDNIEKSGWVMENSNCVALINKAKEYLINKKLHTDLPPFRNCYYHHVLTLSIKSPYEEDDSPDKYLHLYDPHTNTWTKIINEGIHHGEDVLAYTHKNKFYLHLKISSDNNVYDYEIAQVYDTISNKWYTEKNYIIEKVELPCGSNLRISPSGRLQSVNGKVYVVGGDDGDMTAVPDLITYDQISKEWIHLSPMTTSRANSTTGGVNGIIYVFGGNVSFEEDTEALRSGEKYDKELNRWFPISAMNFKRMGATAVVFNGQIYVIGGAEDTNLQEILNKVERYDPLTDTWTNLKSMRSKRAFHSTFLSCGKIFVLGGYTSPGKLTKTFEMYDPQTDTWEYREPMESKFTYCMPLSVPAHFPSPVPNLERSLMNGFTNFHLKEELIRSLHENGFKKAYNRAQSWCIRRAMLGKDILYHDDNGEGKTVLLVIATLQQLEIVNGEISTLVLCFFRETAHKIKQEYEKLSKYMSIKVAISLGGISIDKDKASFENDQPHILIGTPLRISNLIQAGALKLDKITNLAIYDGARILQDREMRYSVEKVLGSTPPTKQIMMLSQTRTEQLNIFRSKHMRKFPNSFIFRGN